MSFILDALKKSEAERQRKSTPGFADIPDAPRPARTPRWLWLVGGLLAINLSMLVVILVRSGPVAQEVESVTQSLETPDTAPQRPFADLVAEAKARERELQASTSAIADAEAEHRAAEPEEQVVREPEPGPVEELPPPRSLSTFNQLRANGTLNLPDLHLDLHVYGDSPADRFVIVNMNKYEEGATLAEGPQLKQIVRGGVVLEHQGTLFFMPRQ